MKKNKGNKGTCQICKTKMSLEDLIPADIVREPVIEIIKESYPEWSLDGFICASDLKRFRLEYVKRVLEANKGEITALENEVIDSLKDHELLSSDINAIFERQLTFGERLSDRIAEFGGSWRFIIIFGSTLLLWICVNSAVILWRPFDPYPYIFLNLVLSCLAAIQAPIIMMSQNRQEDKDRMRSEQDYIINLKAELEIRHLHEKMDHLLKNQWERLLEIQNIQLEFMEEIAKKNNTPFK